MWVRAHTFMCKCMCVMLLWFFVSCGGPDAVSCGPDEETGLYGCSAELHLSSQPCTPTGKSEVGSDSEQTIVCAVVCIDRLTGWQAG